MIGRNYPAYKWTRVFQADINKNIPKCYALGISIGQKEFCCGLIKMKKSLEDNVGNISKCQVIRGFEDNGNEFGFYSECIGNSLEMNFLFIQ